MVAVSTASITVFGVIVYVIAPADSATANPVPAAANDAEAPYAIEVPVPPEALMYIGEVKPDSLTPNVK